MKSNVEVLTILYKKIVGSKLIDDFPVNIPESGFYSSQMDTVNNLHASIRFGTHQSDGKYKQSAILLVYASGEGPEGNDAVYLEIQAFDDPSGSVPGGFNRFLYDKVPGRQIERIKECQVILNLLSVCVIGNRL